MPVTKIRDQSINHATRERTSGGDTSDQKRGHWRMIFCAAGILATTILLIACGGQEGPAAGARVISDAPAINLHTDQSDIDSGRLELDEIIQRGEALMVALFNTLDGAGRPETTGAGGPRARREIPENFNRISSPDANSCAGCHNQPRAGGGGDNVANVFVLGQVHEFLTLDGNQPPHEHEHTLQNAGNERGTVGMFGSGYIELLAREMTADLQRIRDDAMAEAKNTGSPVTKDLISKGVRFGQLTAHPDGSLDTSGVEGVDDDLIIKPFHQKGAVISLREFTNNAMNHHHGMQSAERFGDGVDADKDGIADELTRGDITAITIFQAALPVPGQVMPRDPAARDAVDQGEALFGTVGCAVCHVPALRLESPVFTEPNPFNPPGNLLISDVAQPFSMDLTEDGPTPHLKASPDGSVMVPAFTDLKRHDMGEALNNEQLVQGGIPTNEWLARKLWGMATEPPFLHHGRATLISEGILMHGGDAQASRDAYAALSTSEQAAVVEFLKTLQVLPAGASSLLGEASLIPSGQVGPKSVSWFLIAGFMAAVSVFSLVALSRRRSADQTPSQ